MEREMDPADFDEIKVPEKPTLQDAQMALASISSVARELAAISRGLQEYGNERLAVRVGLIAHDAAAYRLILDRYIGNEVSERLVDAQRSTFNLLKGVMAGIEIGDKAKSA